MKDIKTLIPDIETCKEIKDNEDGTKEYEITAKENVDLRKTLFTELPKNNITIFELKKTENSLEDAFLRLIRESSGNSNEKEESKKDKKGGSK